MKGVLMNETERFYFAQDALLTTGWARRVRVGVNDTGLITSLTCDVDPQHGDFVIDGALLPGIPNLHSHSFQRGIAGRTTTRHLGSDNHFWTWREAMYHAALQRSPEEIEAIAAQCFLEMLSCGYTSVAEFHYVHKDPNGRPYHDLGELSHAVIRAALRVGLPITHLPVLYRWSGVGAETPRDEQRRFILSLDEYADLISGLDHHYNQHPLVKIGIAPHSLRAVSSSDLDVLTSSPLYLSANGERRPFHIHIAEQTAEVDMWIEHTHQRPVEWLLDHYAVDEHWCLVHATHVNADEAKKMAQVGLTVGLCPSTEADLGDGIFPLNEFLNAGGRYGIGSDSNLRCDPAEELRLLEWGQRLHHRQRNLSFSRTVPNLIDEERESLSQSLILAAVQGGSAALHRPTGIEVGRWADWFTLDKLDMGLSGAQGYLWGDQWVFAQRTSKVKTVFIAGEDVITDGQHPLAHEIRTEFDKVMKRG
jgi:formimidoylglutamate deiminase